MRRGRGASGSELRLRLTVWLVKPALGVSAPCMSRHWGRAKEPVPPHAAMGSLAGAACGSIASSSSVSLARTIRLTLHANALRYTASSTLPPPRTRSRPSPCPRFISEFVPSIPARTPYRLRHSLPDSALASPFDVHSDQVRVQNVHSAPCPGRLWAPPVRHRAAGAERTWSAVHAGEDQFHPLRRIFPLVRSHCPMPCRTRRSPDCGSVDVEVGSRQHHRPITPRRPPSPSCP